ncbi:MAG: hypothetical protein AAGG48_10690 [Planctomycetota bacterium]
MSSKLKYFVPSLGLVDALTLFFVACVGAIVAGCYGAIHDQITFTISPEYFTKLKFQQFAYADFGFGDRVFVATIGFLATWWVGLIIAWFLARRYLVSDSLKLDLSKTGRAFFCVFATCAASGLVAYAYDVVRGPDVDMTGWNEAEYVYGIVDLRSFATVASIHSASYLGGPIGTIIALVCIHPAK